MRNRISAWQLLFGYSYIEAYPLLASKVVANENKVDDEVSHSDILGRKVSLNSVPLPIYYHDIDISNRLSPYGDVSIKAASVIGEFDATGDTARPIKAGDVSIWQEFNNGINQHLYEDKAIIVKANKLVSAKGINNNWLCLRRIQKISGDQITLQTKDGKKASTETVKKKDIHGEVLFSFTPKLRIAPSEFPALISYSCI